MARRASGSEQARRYRQAGHDVALQFAHSLGLDQDYRNDQWAKKDVIDPSGDAHSVKAGQKKWQIFLYRRSRLAEDVGFQALNGVGPLLVRCIDAFPLKYKDYRRNKSIAKNRLRTPMRELKDKLQNELLLQAFLAKSIFNSGEVNYLTIWHDDRFHVFRDSDVIRVMGEAFTVENSRARNRTQFSEQKVLFKYMNRNTGELEMRNDSPTHYREIRFTMYKDRVVQLLFANIIDADDFSDEVLVYGEAIRTFGNWNR